MIRMSSDSTATYLLGAVGLCGEFPVSSLDQLDGYYDYNRRRITELVREGYLRDWRFSYRRRTIHSLSLTKKGLDTLREYRPGCYDRIQSHLLAPANAKGDVSKALRLHRNAACLMMTLHFAKLALDCAPPAETDYPVYYASYMLNKRMDADSKGSRASGVIAYYEQFFVLYYLGKSNMRWNPEVESSFYMRIEQLLPGYHCVGRIFIAEDWSLAESLISHAQKKYTNLIRFDKWVPTYLVTNDIYGKALFRAIVDVDFRFDLSGKYRNLITSRQFDINGPLFQLEHWERLRTDDPPYSIDEAFCFDFQKPTVDQINLCDMPIQVLPGSLLTE